MQVRIGFGLGGTALDQVEQVLQAGQFFANRRGQRTHDGLAGTGQALGFIFQQVIGKGSGLSENTCLTWLAIGPLLSARRRRIAIP